MQSITHRDGEEFVEEHCWHFVEVENEIFVVVGRVARLLDARILGLVTDLDLYDGVNVKAGQLLTFDDCDDDLEF